MLTVENEAILAKYSKLKQINQYDFVFVLIKNFLTKIYVNLFLRILEEGKFYGEKLS